jgi:hypothetical protein
MMGQTIVRSRNGALVAAVSSVAVLAVVAGAAIAARQSPIARGADAAPLPVPTPTPTPTLTPKPTPTPTPKATPTLVAPRSPSPTPVGVKLKLNKLPMGRAPQLSYLDGRLIRGGVGSDIAVPGKQNILRAARINSGAVVVLEVGLGGSELIRVDGTGGASDRIPDVQSLVASMDEDAVAFATVRKNPDHTLAKGSTIYWESAQGLDRRSLKRSNDWGTKVLAVVGETVYFESDTDQNGLTSTLNSWDSATNEVNRIKSVRSPVGVDYRGTAAVDAVAGAAQTFCSTLTALGSGKQLWRTCEYAIKGFTPDGKTAIGAPDFRNGGSDPLAAALDANDGNVRREWSGVEFLEAVAEDDDHLLMVADSGEGTPSAIIRCAISTGACELATPLAKTARYDMRLLGAWS